MQPQHTSSIEAPHPYRRVLNRDGTGQGFPEMNYHYNRPDSCKTDTGKPPFKASEGGCFENLRVSEDITPSEFQQGKGTRVPIRPKVRLEASPNGLPMSVSSKVYQR